MTSSSSFDPGNMGTPPSGSKRAWDEGDDAAVTAIDFSKKPKWNKSTHVDAFPANKPKHVTTAKVIELENWRTGTKIGLWGVLFNVCVKYNGNLLVELNKICEVSKCDRPRMYRSYRPLIVWLSWSFRSFRYVISLNGCIVSDIDPKNWPSIVALFQAEPTLSSAEKKALLDASHRFDKTPLLKITAVYDEMAGNVHVTLGRSSFRMSDGLRFMGCKMKPDTQYLEYDFETNEERGIAYVRVNLKKLATDFKWELELIWCQQELGMRWLGRTAQCARGHTCIYARHASMKYVAMPLRTVPSTHPPPPRIHILSQCGQWLNVVIFVVHVLQM
jgi:hypothetical protein